MKILSIGTDRKLFEKSSAIRARQIEYGKLFGERHIIVFNTESKPTTQISENVFVYPTNSLSKFFYVRDAIKIGKKILSHHNPYSPIHNSWFITCQDPFETGLVGWWLAKKFKLPLELQIHTDLGSPYFTSLKLGWRLVFLNFIRLRLAKFLLPKADQIRVVSARIKNYLVSDLGIAENKIEVRPIKVDEEKIKSSAVLLVDDLQKKYPQFDFIALAAGRLEPEKNFGLMIEAWRAVVKKFPRAGLIIVGSGSLEKNLKRKAKNEKLTDNIIFESWQNDLISYYKTADVFLNTSFYEGYGLALAEAARTDCPIVSSDVGIVGEISQSGRPVFICPINDKDCFVAKINGLSK